MISNIVRSYDLIGECLREISKYCSCKFSAGANIVHTSFMGVCMAPFPLCPISSHEGTSICNLTCKHIFKTEELLTKKGQQVECHMADRGSR